MKLDSNTVERRRVVLFTRRKLASRAPVELAEELTHEVDVIVTVAASGVEVVAEVVVVEDDELEVEVDAV